MFKRARAKSDRSRLRRRLEAMIQFAALLFFAVLGTAIYQDVSKGTPSSAALSSASATEPGSNSVGSNDARPRERELAAAGPNEPVPDAAPPSDKRRSEEEPSVAGPTATVSSEPPPSSAPPTETRPSEQGPSTTGSIKLEPEAGLLSPAPLDCERGSPTSWQFANVELIDSAAARASSLVTSCHVNAVSLESCQNAVIVGVGVASTKGMNATESARALRRGINLASALRKDLQVRCTTNVTVSAYVLNLGRYNDAQQRDEPDQRKVIALVATGSTDADKAAADAVATYAKSDPKIAHYSICELYKLDEAGQPTPISTQHNNCSEHATSTASQQ